MSNADPHVSRITTILGKCAEYVKDNSIKVPDPLKSFVEEQMYTQQVGCSGTFFWYQLPKRLDNLIIAYWDNTKQIFVFDPQGWPTVEEAQHNRDIRLLGRSSVCPLVKIIGRG